jgi:hypothetical protein
MRLEKILLGFIIFTIIMTLIITKHLSNMKHLELTIRAQEQVTESPVIKKSIW